MIPKSFTEPMLKNRKARLDIDTANRAGCGISAGTIVTILRVVRGKGLEIKTEKCPQCGQYAYISGVSRENLSLIWNEEAQPPKEEH